MNRRFVLPIVIVGALLLAACGGDSSSDESPQATTSVATEAPATTAPDDSPATTAPDDSPATTAPDDSPATTAPAETPDDSYEGPVSIETSDGVTLAGDIVGTGTTGVVLAHMRGASRGTWADFAEVLAANGYRALYFDFRGYGDSEGDRDTNLDIDLAAVVESMTAAGVTDVFVFGASMGATASVVTAANFDLAGVSSLSGPSKFGDLDALEAAGQLNESSLFVVAESDGGFTTAAQQMAEAAGTEPLILPGGSHGTNMFADNGEQLEKALLDFIAANV
ncbi:MAG: alpha/beta fold hydrolase [Acidimicrobiales bacterium]